MHLPAKKSLGQNFLKSKEAVRDIVSAADIQPGDNILEIGPGKGVLTEALLAKLSSGGRLIAIEKDDRMIPLLREAFAGSLASGKLILIHGDILEMTLEKLAECGLREGQYKIIANIPYYITGQLLRMFLESAYQPSKMVLMLQKEVAQRIVARDGKESILSISVKAYGTPKYIAKVPAKYFSPEPKVDSAILLIDKISKQFFLDRLLTETAFFEVVKKGFSHKRKILASNLEIPAEKRAETLATLGLGEKVRAEEVTLEHWGKLCAMI
ncbi:MAG: 16S rRNA (adenine(1518)-N(6)/adenine(1519)-N(6))-dimethyltransferase RsmA [bacterium]